MKAVLVGPPREYFKKEWEIHFSVKFLCVIIEKEDDFGNIIFKQKIPAENSIKEFLQKDKKELRKILKSIEIQLGEKHLLRSGGRVSYAKGKKNKYIFEFKVKRGRCRLAAFQHPDNENIIIITNGYWKGKGRQDRFFEIASELRKLFIDSLKEKKNE